MPVTTHLVYNYDSLDDLRHIIKSYESGDSLEGQREFWHRIGEDETMSLKLEYKAMKVLMIEWEAKMMAQVADDEAQEGLLAIVVDARKLRISIVAVARVVAGDNYPMFQHVPHYDGDVGFKLDE